MAMMIAMTMAPVMTVQVGKQLRLGRRRLVQLALRGELISNGILSSDDSVVASIERLAVGTEGRALAGDDNEGFIATHKPFVDALAIHQANSASIWVISCLFSIEIIFSLDRLESRISASSAWF